jgi:hypothetical protein
VSRITSSAVKVAPAAADGLQIVTAASNWGDGDWVVFLEETTAADTAVAGLVLHTGDDGWSELQAEVGFGICRAGFEFDPTDDTLEIGHIRVQGPNSGNGGPTRYSVPHPISGIPPGYSVLLRMRQAGGGGGAKTRQAALLYYENLDNGEAIPYTVARLTSIPAGTDSLLLTPSATPWDPSPWVEFDPEVGDPTYIMGVALGNPSADTDVELDLGAGAADAEVPLTTFRVGTYAADAGRLNNVNLPGLMPITPASRLAACMRKSGASTTPMAVAFLAYVGDLEGGSEGGVIGPYLWITIPIRPPVV